MNEVNNPKVYILLNTTSLLFLFLGHCLREKWIRQQVSPRSVESNTGLDLLSGIG